jgi:signal transduction histidine kinase
MGESVKLELLDSITVGADRLNSLIKDILALTDASSGIAFCTKSVVDAARIVGEALERCRLHDDSHDYVVDLNDGDYTCEVDEHRIRSALLYVLDNARKFSSPGTRIKVSLEGDEECVHVSVTDQGIGISQWHLANIFDKFTQVDCGDTRPAAGTGNGLYLAREIVRRHEGDIYVTSEPGVGSTFRITLPRSGVFNGKGLIH